MKNIGEAFSFPFHDPNWVTKFLIGGLFVLLSCMLIGIPVLFGYYVELLQRTRRNEKHPLPEWSELGVKFILGIKYIVTLFLYYMPLLLIVIPVFFFLVVASLFGSEPLRFFGETTLFTTVVCVLLPYGLLINVLTPIISIQFAARESVGDGLRVGTVLHLFRHYWQDAVIATLIAIGTALLSVIGIIVFFVGILFTVFYATLVRFHLYGQIALLIDESSNITQVQTS